MKTFSCALCREETHGAYSEGGIQIAICEECYKKSYENREKGEEKMKHTTKNVEDMIFELRWLKTTDDGDYRLQYRIDIDNDEWIDVPFVLEGEEKKIRK